MTLREKGDLLRIFIGESDTWRDKPLYEAIVERARQMHLAGATVLRSPMGFGKNSHMKTAKLLELSSDLPILVEILDTEDRIREFLPVVDEMVQDGLVTLEPVQVLKYAARSESTDPSDPQI